MTAYRTGGEVDSYCTRCRMVLAHTILAMVAGKPVRVQCNTCDGQHNFRPASPEAKSSTSAARTVKTPRASASRMSFDEMLAEKGAAARPYSPKVRFIIDEVIQHPTFGRGFVSAVRPDKVDVTFRSGVKTLIHGRA